MEAPQEPIFVSVVFGKEENTQNLIKFDVSFDQGQNHVKDMAESKKLPAKQGSDSLYLSFDFYVEQGRQQQAVEYFKIAQQKKGQQNLSPLQRVFRYKGSSAEEQGFIVNTIQAHQGFVRVYYEIMLNQHSHHEYKNFTDQFKSFEDSAVNISTNISFDLKGSVAHNKKNRQNVKVDYAKLEVNGSKFFGPELTDYLISMQVIEADQIQYFNPYIDLLKKSKKAKINLKFDSFRKIRKYYSEVAYANDKPVSQPKQFPYTNQGIFRQRAEFNMIFKKYCVRVTANYESQDVFIRLIKIYGKTLNKIFDTNVIYR